MNAERYNRVVGLFQQAVELEEPARSSFLDESCVADPELRRHVDSMLASDADDRGVLGDAELGVGRKLLAHNATGTVDSLPDHIGRYEIVRVIGTGGMGCVYEAIQDHPRRTVALKVIRPDLISFGSTELFRRFELEAEILGRLTHPGIAQVFEAGTVRFNGGTLPFVAMEFVRGESITRYAENKRFSTRDRLRMFASVCDAAHHAHQQGVIHRDLKPGNIFVNERGDPKILDFGVARITDSDIRTTMFQTNTGQMIGTIAYMSPEQVVGDPRAIDARCDVYSLGVVLYELLTGRLPHDITGRPIVEAARIIKEEDPSRLSVVDRRLRGDLETIVSRAMEKDPARRYATASSLAADIHHYLNNEPIIARPASTLYQFRKFARRNRALVGGVAASFILLVAGLVSTSVLYVRAERQRRVVSETVQFLNEDLLGSIDPANARGKDVTVREALDGASQRIEGRFPDDPLVEASLRLTIGKVYSELSAHDAARPHLERAVALRRKELGPSNLETLDAVAALGRELGRSKKFSDAETLERDAIQVAEQTYGEDADVTLKLVNDLADSLREAGRPAEALPLFERLVRQREHSLGPDHEETLTACNNLAIVFENMGKYDQAERLQRRVCETRLRTLGEDHPNTITSMNNLGYLYSSMDRYADAETWLSRAVKEATKVLGPLHDLTLLYQLNLSIVYGKLKRWQDAAEIQSKLLDAVTHARGTAHPQFVVMSGNYGWTLTQLGRLDEARNHLAAAAKQAEKLYEPDNWKTALWQSRYGECLRRSGRPHDARPILANAHSILVKNFGVNDRRAKMAGEFLGETERDLKRNPDIRP